MIETIAFIAIIAFVSWFAMVRDAYDQARWKIDPYYPRYGATLRETCKWWWTGKMTTKRTETP